MSLSNETNIIIENLFTPRPYQQALIHAMLKEKRQKALICWPRRSGKDITVWHILLRKALERVGLYLYCLPTYSQARICVWNAIRTDEVRFLDMIPPELIAKVNESTMTVTLVNGSRIQLTGSDAHDRSIRGSNALGVVFSEFSRADPEAYTATLPIIEANKGFCIILSTPFGKNEFYHLYLIAKANPDSWFCQKLTVDDTKHIDVDAIKYRIACGEMSQDKANEEYWCDFETGTVGAFYATILQNLKLRRQIGSVEYLSHLPVITAWDLGIRNNMSVIFAQINGTQLRIFDFYENTKYGLDHYCKEVLSRPYLYAGHIAPHDIRNRELTTGLTRLDMASDMGIDFTVCPSLGLFDGIEQVKAKLSLCWFDEERCSKLLEHLAGYRQEYDSKLGVYKSSPLHDNHSDAADAMRYLCIGYNQLSSHTTPEDVEKSYKRGMMSRGSHDSGPFSQYR